MHRLADLVGPRAILIRGVLLAEHVRDLRGRLQVVDPVAVVVEQRLAGVAVDALGAGPEPVAEEIPLAAPPPQHVVLRLGFEKRQPPLHRREVLLQDAGVAVALVDLPRQRDAEAAPAGPAAAPVGRGRVRQIAAFRAVLDRRLLGRAPGGAAALDVAPVLGPLRVERPETVVVQAALGRRVAVAAVAHPLAVRAIDDVAAQAQVLEGPQGRAVDPVQQIVGALEVGGPRVVGPHELGANVARGPVCT